MTKFTLVFRHNPFPSFEFWKKMFRTPIGHTWSREYDSNDLMIVNSKGQLIEYHLNSNDKKGFREYGKALAECFDNTIFLGLKRRE